MEPVTLTAIAVFLSPFLKKAGEKVAEKTIETLFESRRDLAEKFTGLFKTDIISLGLSDSASTTEVRARLEASSEAKASVENKVVNNQRLLAELVEAFRQLPQAEFEGITINAKNIGQVINNPTGAITQNNTFS
jgi:hypothetical protein